MNDSLTQNAVRAEQIRTLYNQSVPVYLTNPVNAAIVAVILWRVAPHGPLLAWVAAMALVTAVRLHGRRRYWQAQPAPDQAARWGRTFVVSTTITGVLWGLGALMLFHAADEPGQLLVTFLIGGMTAGAAGTLAAYMPAFIGFTPPALIPIGIYLLLRGTMLHFAMGIMLTIYGLALLLVARNNNRSIAEAFRLRFENEDLLVKLSATQKSLEDVNRGLEKRVAERTADLQKQGEALRHALRLESVGLLAGGVAHDFNNLLTVVLANVQYLVKSGRLDPTVSSLVEEIGSAAKRAADLVSKLLAFSRRQGRSPIALDLNAAVASAHGLLRRAMPATIDVAISLHPEPLTVEVDPLQLDQVIINLATNARDAMPNGGTLTIATGLGQPGDDSPMGPAPYVVLTVKDTGVGMDEETRERVFDPFFTTKEPGRGTGLGLATVYGIVEQNGGRVSVQSQPGQGTVFRVILPLARTAVAVADTSAAARAQPTQQPALRNTGTILLAEDDQSVRAVIGRTLRGAGYTVLIAENGVRALACARGHVGRIDLLLTDVVMAEMGGIELARTLAAERPGVRVLFMSGYSWNAAIPTGKGNDFMEKPFADEVLLEKVGGLLVSG